MRRGPAYWLRRATALALLLLATDCRRARTLSVPGGSSPASAAAPGHLRAGIGRADITPPPAGGLMGNGPEGREARGYRQRLYARALLLEDPRGERLAFVVADLGEISLVLQRRVADAVVARTRIGADRLILSATHTHSAPSHYFAMRAFDDFGSSVAGFDPALLDFLATRIASAILAASDSLHPARAMWAMDTVQGQTHNRAFKAFELNRPRWRYSPSSPIPTDASSAVDPRLTMLRVDLWDSTTRAFRPASALSIFAMHGTANASWNELYDGDVHAVVERALEHHIDSLNGIAYRPVPRAVHLLANGAEGDVSPNWRPDSRCEAPVPAKARRVRGPRAPRAPDVFTAPQTNPPRCLSNSRRDVARVGDAVGKRAIEIFDAMTARFADAGRERDAREMRIARTFEVAPMLGVPGPGGTCPDARIGLSSPVGTTDNITRFDGWKLFGIVPLGFDSAGAAMERRGECQSPKQPFLGPLQRFVAGSDPLPDVAQLMVARVGGMIIGVTPGELTTTAGARARDSMAVYARAVGAHADSIALIGLANGYIYYVTTPEEYDLQRYEGASTLYGRHTSLYLTRRLSALAAALPPIGSPSPPAVVPPRVAHPGATRRLFPSPRDGPAPNTFERRVSAAWSAQHDTLVIRWNDLNPGRMIPADGLRIAILRRSAAAWDTVAWDDDRNVEVWARGDLGGRGFRWEARWSPDEATRVGPHRVVLLPIQGMPAVSSQIIN